jgi:hypothetical protein
VLVPALVVPVVVAAASRLICWPSLLKQAGFFISRKDPRFSAVPR